MLYPQSNPFRQCINLSGFWDFCLDPDGQGEGAGWYKSFTGGRPIAVPASWNDQFEDWRDYLGPAWYQTNFDLPWGWEQRRVNLRFGSVNYLADKADMIVVSATPVEALTREWQEHGIARYVRVIAGQEMGKKALHLSFEKLLPEVPPWKK